MQRVSQLVGKPIVTADTGEKVGHAADLLVSPAGDRVIGVVVGSGVLGSERVLPYDDVQALGDDAIVARSQERVMSPAQWQERGADSSRSSSLKDKQVVTTEGRTIGTIKDVCVDERTGEIEGYDLGDRIFGGLISRRRMLPRSGDVTLGRDVVVVSQAAAEALDAMTADEGEDGVRERPDAPR